jgi:predicted nucleic acid-binding Zn ribbon protein
MAIQQHKHCHVCEKAIPADQKFCSERCENIYEERTKRAKRTQWMFYAIFAIIIGWFLIAAFMSG